MINPPASYAEIREGVRAVCSQFPAEYHRKVDEEPGYPEAFVTGSDCGGLARRVNSARRP
jgi:acyl-CoA dehydrogenase